MDFFAVTAPGLEPLTAQEFSQLRQVSDGGLSLSAAREEEGGIAFHGDLRALYLANLHLRTASRVVVRFGEFYAAAFSELRKKAARLPWEDYLSPGQPVTIRATCHKSKLYHSDAVAERTAGAIEDRLGKSLLHQKLPMEAEESAWAAPLVIVRLVHDKCTLSIDSSGALLHQRGYRLATAKAPLRETLAAAMVLASGWDKTSPLLDPFCGSGTIAIEAARLARNIAPGSTRHFAFIDWPSFDPHLWKVLLAEAESRRLARGPMLLASDRDEGAIAAAQGNATRAGVAEDIDFSRRAVSAIEPPPGPGWVVTNPPYGVRISGNRDLRNLYAKFGQVLRAKCPDWQVTLLTPAAGWQPGSNLEFDDRQSLALVNGGLRVKLVRGRVPQV